MIYHGGTKDSAVNQGSAESDSGTAQVQWAVLKENDYRVSEMLEEFEKTLKDYIAAHPTTADGMESFDFTLSASGTGIGCFCGLTQG